MEQANFFSHNFSLKEFGNPDFQSWLDQVKKELQWKEDTQLSFNLFPDISTPPTFPISNIKPNFVPATWKNIPYVQYDNVKDLEKCIKSGAEGCILLPGKDTINVPESLPADFALFTKASDLKKLNAGHRSINVIIEAEDQIKINNQHKYCLSENSELKNDSVKAMAEMLYRLTIFADELLKEKTENPFDKISFCLKGNNLLFAEMARIRAMKILSAEISRAYGYDYSPVKILYVTSPGKDHDKTLITNTIQAIGGICGGSDFITCSTNNENASAFHERISNNIPLLLKYESYFDKFPDAVTGSVYIEGLCNQFSNAVWEAFLQMDERRNG